MNLENIKKDIPSGLVVFLVALPLCLGIAMASGAPLFAGIISGIIGGIVIGSLSNSQVSVSGPAAGLAAIVLMAITNLGAFETFLLAVVIAGIFQVILGLVKAGAIADFFPTAVVEGMLAGIGIIIILKQIPHAFGYDRDIEGDLTFVEKSGSNTISTLLESLDYIHYGAIVVSVIGILIMIMWEKVAFFKKLTLLPGALVVVAFGIVVNQFFSGVFKIEATHLVKLPIISSLTDLGNIIVMPDWSQISNKAVWTTALTLAVVASLETLLCIEASDKLDVQKRFTNQNRELIAQGIGNTMSGLIGGLPVTSVVVRTTANITSGAQSKMSTIIHGLLLLICVLAIPHLLNMIPLAALAAILLMIGYKLAKPSKIMAFFKRDKKQFFPFIVTMLAVVFTDLLTGVFIGLIVSIFTVLLAHTKNNYFIEKEELVNCKSVNIMLAEEVTFLNKPAIKKTLSMVPTNAVLNIDASNSKYVETDIIDLIKDFTNNQAKSKNITVNITSLKDKYDIEMLDHVEIS